MGAVAHNRSQPIMRLPMDRVAVTLSLESGEALTGEVFLAPGTPPCTVLDEADPFVPVALGDGIRLVARATITSLAIASEVARDPDVEEESQRARLKLKNGMAIEGELRWVPTPGYRRTIDHLNLAARILALHGAGSTTYIIKSHVAWVEEC